MKIKVADEAGYSIVLRRKRATHNEDRFYSMTITRDLFGGFVLMRHWGRVGTAGKQRCDLHQDNTSAVGALTQLTRKKRKRHYIAESGTALAWDRPKNFPALAEPKKIQTCRRVEGKNLLE